MVPRRSLSQSLYTSRTISMADPGAEREVVRPGLAGPNRNSNVPSPAISIARSSNAVRLSGTSTGV